MARSLSTSSSENAGGLPIALFLALALVVAFEVALRVSGWPHTWPYDMGRMEYSINVAEIARDGGAEVSIVGSSRTRESLIVPLMSSELSKNLGRPVKVASYAESGAYTTDFEAVTDLLLRSKARPKVILIGISERDLIYAGKIWNEVGPFRDFSDLHEVIEERGSEGLDELPVMVRSAVGRYWQTLAYRDFIKFKLTEFGTGNFKKDSPGPQQGGDSIWQRSSPTRNLVKNPLKTKSRVLERSANFRFDDFPDPQLEDALRDLLTACKANHVPVVFYEVHTSKALRDALPKGFYRRFTEYVTKLAGEYGDRYVRLEELNLKLDDTDMREPSHMSVQGATKLTNALADHVIAPLLGEASHAKAKVKKRPATTTAPSSVPSPGTPGEGLG